jgi:hypothetical protein
MIKNNAGKLYLYTLHTELSKLFAKNERYDEMYDQLSLWFDEAVFVDSLSPGEHGYENNILMDTQKYKREIPDRPNWGMEYMQFHLGAAEFCAVRETERFKAFLANAKGEYQKKVTNKQDKSHPPLNIDI